MRTPLFGTGWTARLAASENAAERVFSEALNRCGVRSGRYQGGRRMQIRFDGKTVVVSGAGHGFGRCIAETFAGLGAGVFGCDLVAAELAETAKAGVSTELLDLTDRAAAAAWIDRVEQAT